jgi:hypothetical protein
MSCNLVNNARQMSRRRRRRRCEWILSLIEKGRYGG